MDSAFHKEERLKSNLAIRDLFQNGKSVSVYPLKVYWEISGDELQKYPVRVAISVPKRKFHRAVDRNHMKRRIREAYRKTKKDLYGFLNNSDLKIVMVILYLSDEFFTYGQIESCIDNILAKLSEKLANNPV